MPTIAFLAALVSTGFMTGVIWFVQVVHYPLFAKIAHADFPAYESRNTFITTFVVLPPMALEAIATLALIVLKPSWIPAWTLWAGAALLIAAWLSTMLLQAPMHGKLTEAWDAETAQRLITTNWIRTVAWTLRLALLVYPLWVLLSHEGEQ